MPFEWDDRKARANLAKHGVAFEQAELAFDDPAGYVSIDQKHSTAEEVRHWLIAEGGEDLLVVVYVERSEDRVRIISARRAGRRDRRKYEAQR